MNCPRGREYFHCGNGQSDTCESAAEDESLEETGGLCIEGCYCPSGTLVAENGTCVNKRECPCYLAGKRYNPGDEVKQDCNVWLVF